MSCGVTYRAAVRSLYSNWASSARIHVVNTLLSALTKRLHIQPALAAGVTEPIPAVRQVAATSPEELFPAELRGRLS